MRLVMGIFGPTILLLLLDPLLVRSLDWYGQQGSGTRFVVNQSLSAFVLLFMVVLVQAVTRRLRWKRWAVAAVAGVAAFVQAAHFSIYRELVSPFGILFFLSNPGLSLSAGSDVMSWGWSLLSAATATLIVGLMPEIAIGKRALIVSTAVIISGVVFSAVHWYALPVQQNFYVSSIASLVDSARVVTLRSARFARPTLNRVEPKVDAPNIVWVIGESLNRDHMGIYGYGRDTTPELAALEREGAFVRFRDVTTIGVHTLIAVPYMLVGMEGIDPGGLIFQRPTVFAYAHAAGYRTAFVSAQETRWGNLESLVGVEDLDLFRNGSAFASNVSVHKGADDMDVVQKGLLPFVRGARGRYLAVVQMDGSHYPYSEHSPKAFKRFLPEEKRNGLNAYDNTVAYTDHVVATLYREIRAIDRNAWIIFSPDHADGVKRTIGMFHHPTSRSLMHVPLLVFPPQGLAQEVARNAGAPVSQSDLLPTLLGLMGVEPQAPLDGFNLLGTIPADRVRVVSAYMSTLSPDPVAMLVDADGTNYRIDVERRGATRSGDDVSVPFEDLEPRLRKPIEGRLETKSGESTQ